MNIIINPMYELVVSRILTSNKKYASIIFCIKDILIVGKVGYIIITPDGDPSYDRLGDHGYDNRDESMHPIFYGFGPVFRRNLLAEPFRNVDLYPLMSYILHLNQRLTNGSLDNVKHILIGFPEKNFSTILGK